MGRANACPDLAAAAQTVLLTLLANPYAPTGVFHFSNAGETNWKGFAEAIFAASAAQNGPFAAVEGIPTEAYPTPARRPRNSRSRRRASRMRTI